MNKKLFSFISIILLAFTLQSCAVYKATEQPGKKDLSVLNRGTDREKVIAELGKPVHTSMKHGHRVDVFSFVQGYSTGVKTARALGHGVADVMTMGLWEVVGTPIEGIANGTENKVKVVYKHNRVERVIALAGKQAASKATG